MTVYAYKRCSTNEDRQSVERQLFGMKFDQVFKEYASGKNEEGRPVFQKMISMLKEGDELWFNDMSRAGRNTKQLLHTVESLIAKGVKVIFKTEGLTFISDTLDSMAGAISKMLLTMLSAVNELFLAQSSIAIKQGMKAAKARGVKIGAASPKHKETYEKNRHLHKTTHLSEKCKKERAPISQIIKDMLDYSNNSLTLAQVAFKLNSKGITTVRGKSFSEASVSRIIKQDKIPYKRKHKYDNVMTA